jgi:aminomethyltransferase
MKRTALFEKHSDLGANIINFYGWEMPLHYSKGTINEHLSVRNSVGIFDVSHMGDFLIFDSCEGSGLQNLLTNNVRNVEVGKSVYTHLPDEEGRIIDDLIVTKLGDGNYFCVPNASMVDVVKSWMIEKANLEIIDLTPNLTCIAIQGPYCFKGMETLFGEKFGEIDRFTIKPYDFKNKAFLEISQISKNALKGSLGMISRTGYTGEEGFEIILPNVFATDIWDALIGQSAQPIGLGARDTLRLEMGYLLSGQDFKRDRTSMETNCSWVIKWDHEFIGKGTMERQRASKDHQKMIGINVEGKAPARTGGTVALRESPQEIMGSVSSGNYSPTLGHAIALAYVDREYYKPGLEVALEHRGRLLNGVTTKTPFVKK